MIHRLRISTALAGALMGLSLVATGARAEAPSALFLRGYNVMPAPQQVELKGGDFEFDSGWRVELGAGVKADDVAAESLKEELSSRDGVTLETAGRGHAQGKVISLAIRAGSVEIGEATDRNKASLEEQAYKLELSSDGIRITANAGPGLLYGAETLVQLVKSGQGKLWLPAGTITDWPDLGYREIFWDEQKHLDRFEVMKQAVRRAAFFKVNAISLRLNEYFEYASAPALVNPYAMTAAQLQELTDYGLHYHLQIVPYLDGPAHVNWILERPEYHQLREYPNEAFEMCSTNPETYKLLEGMYQDLMDANKGGQYFHLSTDEAWFVGLAHNDQCNETDRAKELGSPSRMWVEYTQKTAAYLHDRGRKVIFWGETPMQAEDIPQLPSWLINGEIYSKPYNDAFKAHGIQQMIYASAAPDDPLFPAYYVLSPNEQLHARGGVTERATGVFDDISNARSYTGAPIGRQQADLVGVDIYAWGDENPHPETFWLGYGMGASAAWHPGSSDPRELTQSFYRLFYGQGATDMGRLYQLMSTQSQFFGHSWESMASGPVVFGYSYGVGPFTPHVSTLPLPPVPTADYLVVNSDWAQQNARRLELSWKFLGENDELLNLLYKNLPSVQFNHYNLEVYLSIAKLCRQNLLMLQGLGEINRDLVAAQEQAGRLHYSGAVAALDRALDTAEKIRDERNQVLQDTTETWYKTWFPRVKEANGRHITPLAQDFVETETTEDGQRQKVGLLYLLDQEFLLPFGEWVNQVQDVRNKYAAAHNLPAREGKFDWQDTTTLRSRAFERIM